MTYFVFLQVKIAKNIFLWAISETTGQLGVVIYISSAISGSLLEPDLRSNTLQALHTFMRKFL
jgi:hypothetical protein